MEVIIFVVLAIGNFSSGFLLKIIVFDSASINTADSADKSIAKALNVRSGSKKITAAATDINLFKLNKATTCHINTYAGGCVKLPNPT